MIDKLFATSLISFLLSLSFCSTAKTTNKEYLQTLSYSNERIDEKIIEPLINGVYELLDTIDLDGKTLLLPSNVKIEVKGGIFKNGRIIGDNT